MRLAIVLAAIAAGLSPGAAAAPTGPAVIPGATLYPRLLEVRHNRHLKGRVLLATLAGIRQSRDDGRTWTPLSAIPQPDGTTERCCGVLYELPRAVGALPAGTFLYAATYHRGPATTIRIYDSADGITWRRHSDIATGGSFGKGVWEPHFDTAADGALVVFWSDETDACCSQKLRRARSYDGQTWVDATDLVRSKVQADRPGMVTTARMADGRTAMTYEICGPRRCAVYIRYSRNGWDYGDPTDLGRRIETQGGRYLAHAPTVTWDGRRLLVVGQMVMQADGRVAPENGRILLTGDGHGGVWRTMPSPVPVPGAYDNYCPNYSSALLPRDDGRALLMVASAYDADRRCLAYGVRSMLR